MGKDKKKKKKKGGGKAKAAGGGARASKVARSLKAMAENPLVADVVAAALVAAAAALKDSRKAREIASSVGDELEDLEKAGSERGRAMWQLALDIARRTVEELGKDGGAPAKAKSSPRKSS